MDANRRLLIRILVASLALAMATAGGAAAAPARPVRVGSAAVLPSGARTVAALPAATKLNLTISLRSQDPSGLQAAATAIATPGSPDFRQYLTVSQFAQRFGASPAAVAAVESALRAKGLTVGQATANQLTVPVTGTAGQVEKAFAVKLSRVRLTTGRVAYANTSAPTLAASVAGYVQDVAGLDNLMQDQPEGLLHASARARSAVSGSHAAVPNVATGGPQPCAAATNTALNNGGYTADLVASMYDFSGLYGAGDLGAGQTIALYELESDGPADIAAYQACYGTNTSVTNVPLSGFTGTGAGSGESELDIEQVIGLAPAAKVLVYEDTNNGAGIIGEYSTIFSQDLAKVVSSSWGGCEPNEPTASVQAENSLFQEAAVQGQSVFAASGDSGSAACSQGHPSPTAAQSVLAVGDPASQPFVTGVGGTTAFANGTNGGAIFWTPGATLVQSVWNDGNGNVNNSGPSGSVGGISKNWAMPSYQAGAAASLGVGAGGSGTPCASTTLCREVPDVSADADPVSGYVVFLGADNGWTVDGGTSAAAPLWAAFTALANASSTCRGQTIGFANPSLYTIAGSAAYASDFDDVTTALSPVTMVANNDAVGTNGGLYPTKVGYDMATGLGTPVGAPLAASLCAASSPVYTVTVTSPGTQTSTVGQAVAVSVGASDSGAAKLTYAAAGLPAGLSINSTNGQITGTPTTAQTTTVSVSASDQYTNVGNTQFAWTVVNPPPKPGKPTYSHVSLGGIAKHRPTLKFTLAAGSNAPALKSVSVSLPGGLSFAKKSKSLAKGIVVKSGNRRLKFKESVKHGTLTITLRSPAGKLTVTIGKPAISTNNSLASKVHRHKVKKLTVRLKATDTAKKATSFKVKLKVK